MTEYEDQGWDATNLEVADVTALSTTEGGSEFGLDLLIPDDELSAVQSLLEECPGKFDTTRIFREEEGGVVFLLIIVENREATAAVLIPAYCERESSEEMIVEARETGTMRTHLRNLTDSERVTFEHHDPDLFFGEDE